MPQVIESSYEVVVVGGGMAGLSAALAASMNGARTLLIERHPYCGGAFTAGLVLDIGGLVDHRRLCAHDPLILDPENWIVKGLAIEYHRRLARYGAAHGPRWDHEPAKVIFDRMLDEFDVDVLYGTQFHTALTEQRTITQIEAVFRTTRLVIRGKIFIDATGDGDLGAEAGVEFYFGRESDGKMSPGTLSYLVGGVDPRAQDCGKVNDLLRRAWHEGQIPRDMRPAVIGPRLAEGQVRNESWWSVVRQWGDFTNPFSYSQVERRGRAIGWEIFRFVKAHTHAFANSYISSMGHQIWPREGRHLAAEYKITADDVRRAARFQDVIARGAFYLDVHSVTPGTTGFDLDEHRDEYDSYFEIPYRSLLTVGVDNLLLAGRTIGATHEGHGATRVMGTGIATGQAAGTAAAIAAREGISAKDVDIAHLQQALRSQGVEL